MSSKKGLSKVDYAKKGWQFLLFSLATYIVFLVLDLLVFELFPDIKIITENYNWIILLFYSLAAGLCIVSLGNFLLATFRQKYSYILITIISALLSIFFIWGALMSFSR